MGRLRVFALYERSPLTGRARVFRHVEAPQALSDPRPGAKSKLPFTNTAFALRFYARLANSTVDEVPEMGAPKLV